MKNLFYLLVISSAIIFAKSPIVVNGHDHQIVYWAFNHQFDKAEQLTTEKIAENPNIPKYYFLKIVTESLRHLADSDQFNYEKRYEYRKEKNEELIEYTEDIVEQLEDIEMNVENKYYMANIYGYLGRMYGLSGSYMSAFSNAKKGKGMLEELVVEHPDLYDAYLMLGMFEYYADRLGGLTKFVASILGFSGDRTRGINYMKQAHLNGELTRPFAEFMLGETYSTQEGNPFDAYGYFNLLVKKYPNNKDFYDWHIRILLQLDNLNEAKEFIEKDQNGYVRGYTESTFYIKNGEYKKAISLIDELIQKKDFKWRSALGNAIYLKAVASLLIDKPITGIEKELSEDQLIRYNEIKNNLKTAKQVYELATMIGRLDLGIQMEIPKLPDLPKDGYLRAMYEFYNGVYYYKYRDGTNAVKFFTKVAKDRKYFRSESVEYLINIFKSYKPTKQQLDELEKIISKLDDEDLEFSFMDLKK